MAGVFHNFYARYPWPWLGIPLSYRTKTVCFFSHLGRHLDLYSHSNVSTSAMQIVADGLKTLTIYNNLLQDSGHLSSKMV